MRRCSLLLCIAVLGSAAAAAQVVVTSSGFATNPGPALQNATPTVTVPTAPLITFVNRSSSPVGATNTTGGNVAGASNATIGNVPGISNASIGVPVYATTQYTPNANLIAEEQAGAPTQSSLTAGTGGLYAAAPGQPAQAVMLFNPGVGRFESAYSASPSPEAANLVEVAAQTRARVQQAQNVRRFTNADLQQLNQDTGVTTAAITPPPGAGSAANTAGMAGMAQAAANPAANASPFTPKTAVGTNSTSDATSSGLPVSSEQPAGSENAPATAMPATQAPNSSPAQEDNSGNADPSGAGSRGTQEQLPGTASLLPLVALIGMVIWVTGLLWRRRHNRATTD